VIRSFRHKGLKRLYAEDDRRGVSGEHAEKLRDILARLDAAATVADMDLPGFRLHPLTGKWKVSGRLLYGRTGELFFGLKTGTLSTSIIWTTTKGTELWE
jgi:proteic killer suppression protein